MFKLIKIIGMFGLLKMVAVKPPKNTDRKQRQRQKTQLQIRNIPSEGQEQGWPGGNGGRKTT